MLFYGGVILCCGDIMFRYGTVNLRYLELFCEGLGPPLETLRSLGTVFAETGEQNRSRNTSLDEAVSKTQVSKSISEY